MELMITALDITGNQAAKGLRLAGKATVAGAAELKRALLAALAAAETVVLDVSGITATDATFFQLLCAAHQSAVAEGRQLSIAADDGNRLGQLAHTCGFYPASGCCRTDPGRRGAAVLRDGRRGGQRSRRRHGFAGRRCGRVHG